MSAVKHALRLYPCIPNLMCRDEISALAHVATQYETDMCSPYNKLRAFLDQSVILERREQKVAAHAKRGQTETELQVFF